MAPFIRTLQSARLLMMGIALAACAGAGAVHAAAADTAQALRAKYTALAEPLRNNPFHRPLYLESTESGSDLKGDVYAVVQSPIAVVSDALRQQANWCAVLMLHLNTKGCRSGAGGGGTEPFVSLDVGKKFDQPLKDAYRIEFGWQTVQATPEYLDVRLAANEGPLGTRNYRIALEAVSVDANRSFIHLSYAYGFGMAGRLAMQAYLATAGSGKVGFTVLGNQGAQPQYIDGVRGLVERNTMRYYLAIETFLESLKAPAGEQLERRIQGWYAATEQFPRQLHEMDRDAYVTMKRSEVLRQQQASK